MRPVPAPTAHFSAEAAQRQAPHPWAGLFRAAADVLALVRFRTAALRGSSRFGAAFALTTIAVLTVSSAWLTAELEGAVVSQRADLIGSYLPVAYAGVLLLSTVAAVSGGGRELLPREQAVAARASAMSAIVASTPSGSTPSNGSSSSRTGGS